MSPFTQTDERTVRGQGFSVTIADERTVRYDEPGRSLNFEISLQCCGGIQFVMHTFPPPDRWDRAPGEERIPLDEGEYKEIIQRTKQALEYLQLQFAID
jgi:hypothetical protein